MISRLILCLSFCFASAFAQQLPVEENKGPKKTPKQAKEPVFSDRAAFAAHNRELQQVPVEAFEFLERFRDQLKIEVWAQSPDIFTPVSMDIDAKGRIWATEGIEYSSAKRIKAGKSIIVMTDTDLDGKADKSHIFITEAKMRHAPLGIAVFDNKIVVSATPSMIVYTDVNRNAVFDPGIDTREEFLTGFDGGNHDHTLHAAVGAPSGEWYFSYGNKGADIHTKDGRNYKSGSYYGRADLINQPSSDGHIYVGGLTMRIRPDGTGLTPAGQNLRNTQDMYVSSFGDVFHTDNDDPAHCRATWLMEHANMGYADLRNGERSWEEVSKTWDEPAGFSRSRRASKSHWRENYPGACPPGTVYGAGSPTGLVMIEGTELGQSLQGIYLSCDMVRKEVMGYFPKLREAQIEMGEVHGFLKLKAASKGEHFLPTDVCLGLDGAIYLSDFHNDTSRRTNLVSGTVYRISRKDETEITLPSIDYTTVNGLLEALKSPSANVRNTAVNHLLKSGGEVLPQLIQWHQNEAGNPWRQARALWIMAQLGDAGVAETNKALKSEDIQLRLTAYRALRYARPQDLAQLNQKMIDDPAPAMKREIALSLRDTPFYQCKALFEKLVAGYDGKNRWYLEALGIAGTKKEDEVYRELVAPRFADKDIATVDRATLNLAWRFNCPEAIVALEKYLRATTPDVETFRHYVMAFADHRNKEERTDRYQKLAGLSSLPAYSEEPFQTTIKEVLGRDLSVLEPEIMSANFLMPTAFGVPTEVSGVETIANLSGDAKQGEIRAASCLVCHKIKGQGVAFGPNLTHWGQSRTIPQIVKDIVDPAYHLAHGYEKPVRVKSKKYTVEGILSNYSYHAGSCNVKTFGGVVKKVLFRRSGARIEHLKNHSWMPSASNMGLTDQDVRNIAEYLHTLGAKVQATSSPWIDLKGSDFLNVNCYTDTWKWKDGHAWCTGRPTGVIRYHTPLTNFELTCEWMHKKKGGNSGIFLWAGTKSLINLTEGQGRLPHGIEVQVLDVGYREVYEKQFKKPGDWFTSHGDVFTVGPVKMNPFPPVGPRGRRSFPSEKHSKGIGQWNHYHIKAIDGEVRLSVNGVEVSGGDKISPATGYLCLESEGAPVEFRNIRLKILPPFAAATTEIPVPSWDGPVSQPAQKAVSLKGHAILGKWRYLDTYTREFTADGICILRNGDGIIWQRPCTGKTDSSVTLQGGLKHILEGEVLKIEGRYEAKR